MPLPMVHLGTARKYAQSIPCLFDNPEFYLGSISPDAIHMRKNTGREDKAVTHLHVEGDLWKDNVIKFLKQHKNKSNYNFLLGYGIHILTDYIWHNTIRIKFQTAYENDANPVQESKWAYYNDTDKLDFELYRICGWRQDIWKLLEKAKLSGVEGILSPDEISAWNNRTLHWFDSGESQHKNPVKYISIEDLIEFTQNAGNKIKSILESEGL